MASDTDVKVTSAKELVKCSWSYLFSDAFPITRIPVVKAAWSNLQMTMKKILDDTVDHHLALATPFFWLLHSPAKPVG